VDHAEAKSSHAAERYILKELPADDADRFEEHFFTCPECAADVRHVAQIAASAGEGRMSGAAAPEAHSSGWLETLREWWRRPVVGLSAAAAILWLTILCAYQARELRHQFKPVATASFVLLPDARGVMTTVSLQEAGPVVVLEADLPGASADVRWDVRAASTSELVGEEIAPAPKAGAVFKVILPSTYLSAGEYVLTVRSVANAGQSWLFHFKVV